MIKFFKSIRKSLIPQNNFSKYLIYAIGEIFLVVVGILIALSLNNWNEDRKDKKLEKYYLHRLIGDLQEDVAEIDTTVKYASEYISIGNSILTLCGQNYPYDIEKSNNFGNGLFAMNANFTMNAINNTKTIVSKENLGRAFGYLFDERIVDMNDFTYKELVSTGKFEVIQNDVLREKLSNYYLKFNSILDIQDNLLAAINEYDKILQKNNIPVINSLTFDELEIQLNTDNGKELLTALRNLIWNHSYSISPFQIYFRGFSLELVNEIEKYLEEL